MSEHRYVGSSKLVNVDAQDKVTGQARYVEDMAVPGMLYAAVLRSEVPHARIVKLDTSAALAMPGVHAVITHEDFEDGGRFGWPVRDQSVLAIDKVRYIGDPIAAVAAETPEIAKQAVQAIALELEPLPVISDMADALKPDAPLIPETSPTGEGNLVIQHIVRNGDPQPILDRCETIFEATYDMPRQEHVYIETEGAFAVPEPDGGVIIHANAQSPFINRDTTADVLGLPQNKVRIIQPTMGGAFGGKDEVVYQTTAQAAKLALVTGKPVRLVLGRKESLIASYKRQAMRLNLKFGVDANGYLQAAKSDLLIDSGAYTSGTYLSSWRAAMHAAGTYRYQAVQVDADVVYTNNGYAGAFRGFGNTQATAAVEMAIDELADQIGQDPIAFRLNNVLRAGDKTMTGDVINHEVGLSDCLAWVRDHSGWADKRAAYASQPPDAIERKGIGVACYFHGSGLGGEGTDFAIATLSIDRDYHVTLTHGLTDFGQGSRTVFTLLAAELLGLDMARIHVLRPDTHTAIDSGPTVASRASIVGGNAVRVASEKLSNLLNLAAANLLGCALGQVQRIQEAYVGPTEEPVAFETVVDHALAMGLQLSVEGKWQIPTIEWHFDKGTGQPYFAYVFGAQIAEVSVNMRSGRTKVLKLWAAHDAGKILFPTGALGQLYGGVAQGIGFALMEDFNFVDGIPQKRTLAQYRIPRATDVPEIEATYVQTHLREGPYGAKNLAEPVMVGTAPAIANAFAHATGQRLRSLPVKLAK